MYHTTGFTRDEIIELCAHVHAVNEAAAESEKVAWPPILGLFMSVVATLTYLRRNRIQAEIGESFGGVSVHDQPSRHGPDAAAGHNAGAVCARG